MSEKPLDQFEQKLVDSYKNYELPYSESMWNGVSRRLLRKRLLTSLTFWSFSSIALLGISFGVYSYFNMKNQTSGLGNASGALALNPAVASIPASSESTATVPTSSSSSVEEGNANTKINVVNPINKSITDSFIGQNGIATSVIGTSISTESPASSNGATESNAGTTVPNTNSTELAITPSIRTGCAGTEIEFNTLNSPKDGSYLWNFGDGSFSNEQTPKHVYKKSGTFDVSLSVTNPKTGQISTKAMHDLIQINPAPSAEFDWMFTNTAVGEPCAKFVNMSTDASGYTWQLGNETITEVSPQMIYSNKGKQFVKLSVSNEYGCFDETVKYVQINNDFNLGAEEKVSLKGFKFMPEALKKGNNKFKLTIYNGQHIVYETTNKAKYWSGELPNNKKVASGETYPWIVLIYGEDGSNARYYSGTLTIVP